MAKRVLMVATVPSMIGQFNMNNIHILLDMGYQVDVAADFNDISVWPIERINSFKISLKELNIDCFQLDFSRNPLRIDKHLISYKQVLRLIRERNYTFIHTHTPIASAIVRLAAKRTKTKVIYTAHGFHFYNGAPIKNWLIFYPLEKVLSRYTDVLITINNEDYGRASRKFKAKKVIYLPGVGIDLNRINSVIPNIDKYRCQLGLKADDVMLISIGELSIRKNHLTVINAIKKMNNSSIHYFICGTGVLKSDLLRIVDKYGLKNNVHFLGYRNDVIELLKTSDVFVFPSIQEGLSVALLEAMACNCRILCSRIRGNVDLIRDDNCLFSPKSADELKFKLERLISNKESVGYSMDTYTVESINEKMSNIYSLMFNEIE